jgi:hypothetical protein
MKYGQDSTALVQGPKASYCEHGNETSNSTEGEELLLTARIVSFSQGGLCVLFGVRNIKRQLLNKITLPADNRPSVCTEERKKSMTD